jgi:hypothetical protein
MKNTFSQGSIRVLIYKEKDQDIWYASALEFNLTVDGNDKSMVFLEIQQAIHDYVASAKEIGDVSLLNQDPDPELLVLWDMGISAQISPIASPYVTFSASVENFTFA